MSAPSRLQTGIAGVDDLLGGGLLPGTLTVVMGATGVGKTQFGLHFAHQGARQEGARGIVFDLTSRGDSQNHREYARRLFGWEMTGHETDGRVDPEAVWNGAARGDYARIFEQSGRRVSLADLDADGRREWKVERARRLQQAITFFYGNFIHGVRRCVIDGVEPAERASDSVQIETFDYVYHQIVRKEAGWLARDLLRERFRAHSERVKRHDYDKDEIGCLLLLTTHEVLLDDLLVRPIETGDVLSNAGTIILMGRTREKDRLGRALCVAKHRGSRCDERIVPFEITEKGLELRP